MKTIGILNGPNLNRLGKREPDIYGSETLADLEKRLAEEAGNLGVGIECFQSNHEGELLDTLSTWAESGMSGAVLNAAGFTHTSVALRDAVASCGFPIVEVHISHIYRREKFRHTSLTAPVCVGVISGLGFYGYVAALQFLANQIR